MISRYRISVVALCLYLSLLPASQAQSKRNTLSRWLFSLDKKQMVEKRKPVERDIEMINYIFGPPSDSLAVHYGRFGRGKKIATDTTLNYPLDFIEEVFWTRINAHFLAGLLYYRIPATGSYMRATMGENPLSFFISLDDSLVYIPEFDYTQTLFLRKEKYSLATLCGWYVLDRSQKMVTWYHQETSPYTFYLHPESKQFTIVGQYARHTKLDSATDTLTITQADLAFMNLDKRFLLYGHPPETEKIQKKENIPYIPYCRVLQRLFFR